MPSSLSKMVFIQSIGTLLLFINGTEKTDHPSHSIVTSLFSALGWELAAFIPQEIKDSKKTVNIEKGMKRTKNWIN